MSRLLNYRESALDSTYDFVKVHVLQTAFELDIFERLGEESKSLAMLVSDLKADQDSLFLFLNAMVGLGFLDVAGMNAYKNTKYGSDIFLKGKPLYIGDLIKMQARSIEDWMKLKKSVLSGKPMDRPDFLKMESKEAVTGFARAMHNTAMGHAAYLAKKVSFDSTETLLDLGGGPGTFTVEFLKKNPKLRAMIFDLPATLEVTREKVDEADLAARVSYQAGDFHVDEIQGHFDACLLSHIIHGQRPEPNQNLFKKIFHALNPGGKLIVQDFFLNKDKVSPQFASVFALNMLIHTDGGRTYTFDEVTGWLQGIGFKTVTRSAFRLPRSISLLIAEK